MHRHLYTDLTEHEYHKILQKTEYNHKDFTEQIQRDLKHHFYHTEEHR